MLNPMAVGHQVNFPLYEDWLEKLQHHHNDSAYEWVYQQRDFPFNKLRTPNPTNRDLKHIRQSVMNSSRVQEAITAETETRQCSRKEVVAEVEEILDIMSHKFDLFYVRLLGWAVATGLRDIFDSIYVNAEQARKIRELCKTSSVVFMPSHRTYLDFLLLSLICFEYEIPLPAIAAGADFLNSPFMGAVLRRCGAFFLRRSFGNDRLYWAVFSEYVQIHLTDTDRTVEFFVEGTRSRVGKSIHPKYGLLQIVLEPYLRGNIFDLTIVPVAMNYDKILEETLYAYELLGFPKPKESTSALFKARDVFKKNFGKCFITFGEPISLRDMFGNSLYRSSFVSQPDSQFVLEENTKKIIRRFGHQIVKANDNNSIITVWPIACTIMLKLLDHNDDQIFHYYDIHYQVKDLIEVLKLLNIVVNVSKTLDEDLRYYISLHDDLFHPMSMEGNFQMRLKDFPVEKPGYVEKDIMMRAVSRLILTTYSNVMIHGVVEAGYIAAIILQLGLKNISDIKKKYLELVQILKREFVFVPGDEDKMFDEALLKLQNSSIIQIQLDTINVINMNNLKTLKDIIMPYICQFTVVLSSILDAKSDSLSVPFLIRTAQQEIARRYELGVGIPIRLSFLSIDPMKNTFHTLIDMKCLERVGKEYRLKVSKLKQVYNKIVQYTGQPHLEDFIMEEAKL